MLRIDDLENKSILVTGASTGIGAGLFPASRQLSGYITGEIIHMNGGQEMP